MMPTMSCATVQEFLRFANGIDDDDDDLVTRAAVANHKKVSVQESVCWPLSVDHLLLSRVFCYAIACLIFTCASRTQFYHP